jgi:hypothetical protein
MLHLIRLLISCLCIAYFALPAPAQEYTAIDEYARSIGNTKEVASLAAALTKACTTEKEKVRCFYVWIADNIRYDIKSYLDTEIPAEQYMAMQKPEQVLKRKKAVCEGYAQLFKALCDASGIACFKINGTTKDLSGQISDRGHSWNIVRVDSIWGAVDVTWGAGSVDTETQKFKQVLDERYFLPPPWELIANHYPDDPIFQLLTQPVTYREFKKNKTEGGATKEEYTALTDSLNYIFQLDTNTFLQNSALRAMRHIPNCAYGALKMSEYFSNLAEKEINIVADSLNALQNRRGLYTVKWCDEQINRINTADKFYETALKYLNRTTAPDHLQSELTLMQSVTEYNRKSQQRLKGSFLSSREKLKKGILIRAVKN